MKFRASWFSENSDRGIAISVSILSSGFSDALFVCFGDLWLWNAYWPFVSEHFWFYRFWTLSLQLEHQGSEFSDCDQNFLIVIQKMQIRIFWLLSKKKCKSEFSDCDQNFLIVISSFWCDQKFLIVNRIFWLWSELFWLWSAVSDCDQQFLIVIRSFWLWSELFWFVIRIILICDQNFLIVIRIFWLFSKKNANQNFLITIRKFWLWSENSLNKIQ